MHRTCALCGETKPLGEYKPDPRLTRKGGREAVCRACRQAKQRASRQAARAAKAPAAISDEVAAAVTLHYRTTGCQVCGQPVPLGSLRAYYKVSWSAGAPEIVTYAGRTVQQVTFDLRLAAVACGQCLMLRMAARDPLFDARELDEIVRPPLAARPARRDIG